eukprot:COSAG02_NODE_922_length_15907_cov_4.423303_6_plen_75_part_00
MAARPPVARRSGCELFRDHQVVLRAVPRGQASPLPLGAHLVANSVAIATISNHRSASTPGDAYVSLSRNQWEFP